MIFMNFGVKKLTTKKTLGKENFDVWKLWSHGIYGMKASNLLRFICMKVVWRSCSYFFKLSYLIFFENMVSITVTM